MLKFIAEVYFCFGFIFACIVTYIFNDRWIADELRLDGMKRNEENSLWVLIACWIISFVTWPFLIARYVVSWIHDTVKGG